MGQTLRGYAKTAAQTLVGLNGKKLGAFIGKETKYIPVVGEVIAPAAEDYLSKLGAKANEFAANRLGMKYDEKEQRYKAKT